MGVVGLYRLIFDLLLSPSLNYFGNLTNELMFHPWILTNLFLIQPDTFLVVIKTVTSSPVRMVREFYFVRPNSISLSLKTVISLPQFGFLDGQYWGHSDWDFTYYQNQSFQSMHNAVEELVRKTTREVGQQLTQHISLIEGTHTPVNFHIKSSIYLHPNPHPVGLVSLCTVIV